MATPAPMLFDLHLHTTRHSMDGQMNPFALVRRAKKLGLAGIVITEHDWLWTKEELDELRAATPQVQVYAGVEVSAAEGHFLVYGVKDPLRVPKGIKVKDLVAEAHRQKAVVIAAHPYRWRQDFASILTDCPELDGLELMSINMDDESREKAANHWREKKCTGLGNSDAHRLEDVGFCYTEFRTPIRDEADLLEALRTGATQPRRRFDLQLMVDLDD